MSINKRFNQTPRAQGGMVRQRARMRRQHHFLVRFSRQPRNPDVVFLPHRLNLK